MWQIVLIPYFIIEYWYYFLTIALIITFVITFNIVRKKKRLQNHRKYRNTGILDFKRK
jgi:hypothetical protein